MANDICNQKPDGWHKINYQVYADLNADGNPGDKIEITKQVRCQSGKMASTYIDRGDYRFEIDGTALDQLDTLIVGKGNKAKTFEIDEPLPEEPGTKVLAFGVRNPGSCCLTHPDTFYSFDGKYLFVPHYLGMAILYQDASGEEWIHHFPLRVIGYTKVDRNDDNELISLNEVQALRDEDRRKAYEVASLVIDMARDRFPRLEVLHEDNSVTFSRNISGKPETLKIKWQIGLVYDAGRESYREYQVLVSLTTYGKTQTVELFLGDAEQLIKQLREAKIIPDKTNG